MRQDRGSRSATARNATGCCAQRGWRKNFFDVRDRSGGEVSRQPGTGGVFVITYDGEVIWERKTDGGFPDVKQLKQRVRDDLDPDRDLGHLDRLPTDKATRPHDRFHYAGHPPPVPQTWKQGRVRSSPLNRSKGRIVMKTSSALVHAPGESYSDVSYGSRATPSRRGARWRLSGLVRVPFRAECLRPTTSLQSRLSGGVETGPGRDHPP